MAFPTLIITTIFMGLAFLMISFIRFLLRSRLRARIVKFLKFVSHKFPLRYYLYPRARTAVVLFFTTVCTHGVGALALFFARVGSFTQCLSISSAIDDSANLATGAPTVVIRYISRIINTVLVGVVSNALSERVNQLGLNDKENDDKTNHFVILGWSSKMVLLVKQLVLANRSAGGAEIIIMCERDRVEMEREIDEIGFDELMGTKVVCRSGNPIKFADLDKISVSRSRCVIVLALDINDEQSDARAVEIVLSLIEQQNRPKGHIVVEIRDYMVGRHIKSICGAIGNIVVYDVINRLMPQCSLECGLAQVWENILGFDNASFYFRRWDDLNLHDFSDMVGSFSNAIPVGVMEAATGNIRLNPGHYVFQANDEILLIANGPDIPAPRFVDQVALELPLPIIADPGGDDAISLLICGWRRNLGRMIMEFRQLLINSGVDPNRLQVRILTEWEHYSQLERGLSLTGFYKEIMPLSSIGHIYGNPAMWQDLARVFYPPSIDYIWIVGDHSFQELHSRSLVTLLHIRDIKSRGELVQNDGYKTIILTEMYNHTTRDYLVRNPIAVSSDFLIPNKLGSSALAMLAQDMKMNNPLNDLFLQENNKLCFKHPNTYLMAGQEYSFGMVMQIAFMKNDLVIGFRKNNGPVIINPQNRQDRVTWGPEFLFIVITRIDRASTSNNNGRLEVIWH